ncbi:MAG TPA: stage II sporulation protein M [Gemmatimonadales bacterium]|nr:stage II sporulation protein M [Gemmatimonadales bacterium]
MPATSAPADYRQHLEIETPEHVVLDLEIAGFGSRMLAATLDTLILFGLMLAGIATYIALAAWALLPKGSWVGALMMLAAFAAWYGYYILFEGLRAGQTPGKRIVGIRVVRDTGHPVTLGAAAVRNLLRTADFLPPPYLTGLLLMALHPRGKRLGDLAAGTVVVRDRPFDQAPARTAPQGAPGKLAAPLLSDDEFRLLAQFVERAATLDAPARERLAIALSERLAGRVPAGRAPLPERLAQLHVEELERRRSPLAGRQGTADRFAERQSPRWQQFQALADRAARRGLDGFQPEELPDFAARYREIAADLARARTYRAGPGQIARLERLVAAGHNVLYRERRGGWRAAVTFVAQELPAAVVSARRTVFVAFLLFAAPAAAGYTLIRERPALAEELVPETMLRRAAAGHARTAKGQRYVEVDWDGRPAAASFIITNNVRIAFVCFAGGIFAGLGSLLLLAYNGLALGTFAGHFANQGLLGYLLEFVVGHGVLELTAIWIAAAAGFLLGSALLAPGELSRADALVVHGRTAIRMVGMAVVLLACAGLIEGFLSTSRLGLLPRALVSGGSLLFLLAYLASGARPRRASAP